MMKRKIILASASPRRRELLGQIGVEFEIMTSDGEEIYRSKEPAEIVMELARQKAEQVEQKCREEKIDIGEGGEIIIGADTIVVRDGEILGKPADERDAFHMIKSLQGRSHQVYTGVAFVETDRSGEKKVTVHAEETKVFVHAMRDEEIEGYIATGEPMDKAGAYGIQGRFAAFIDRIEGDYYNVVGLPVAYVYHQLIR